MSDFGDELFDGFSAQQIFRDEESDGLTFDDIIALVRSSLLYRWRTSSRRVQWTDHVEGGVVKSNN